MKLSSFGKRMSALTGLRVIMEDIAKTTAAATQAKSCAQSVNGAVPKNRQMYNLSIGNPASIPEVQAVWKEVVQSVSDGPLEHMLYSYGPSRGDHALIESIVDYFRTGYGWDIDTENVIVGPGSQFIAFAVATLFAGPGNHGQHLPVVAPILPEYTGYQGICANSEKIVGLPPITQVTGDSEFQYLLDTEALAGIGNAGLFIVSNPSNPVGRGLLPCELQQVVQKASALGCPLLLDHAYGAPFPKVASSPTGPVFHPNVLNCFSLSKAGLPGARIGFAVGPKSLIDPVMSFVSNSCLHANQAAQKVLKAALDDRMIDGLTDTFITPYYKAKTKHVLTLLHKYLPKSVKWRHHKTDGGMFIWLWVDEPWFDDLDFYAAMKDRAVFITPGRHFFLGQDSFQDHMKRCVRVSLSSEESSLETGIMLMGLALQQMQYETAAV